MEAEMGQNDLAPGVHHWLRSPHSKTRKGTVPVHFPGFSSPAKKATAAAVIVLPQFAAPGGKIPSDSPHLSASRTDHPRFLHFIHHPQKTAHHFGPKISLNPDCQSAPLVTPHAIPNALTTLR
jgi:hypothetical protein